ncbi:DUF4365 domain-containing protein [Ornithinimicrobium avium]|uniref:DUF4365 domain-containing protein n=1 Tax=Ornithinimicrobium avium TaxID=2283195 RepID=A0A345NQV2_9MICO|nr:DUF4365 domain-containing protein [Ornithinimicrobium avium]AXH97410.1 DUF4365 domain-containing protein [Ornithinimicrobium avium]
MRVLLYDAHIMQQKPTSSPTGQQKEWFSRTFLVGVAAAAGYPVEIRLNDVNGVDATVHDGGIQTDWQLKGTSAPEFSEDGETLYFDLDVRTYNLFIGDRNASAFLGVVLMPPDPRHWTATSRRSLNLRHGGYWQKITGMPATTNTSSIRIHLPMNQRLSPDEIRAIMTDERKRICA